MNQRAPQEQRTFFVTAATYGRRRVFQREPWADLLVDVCQDNRRKGRFLLHEFVLMPDHFHMLLTPAPEVSLEKAIQFIKGGFSFRVKRELRSNLEVWQPSFTEHRVQEWSDYLRHRKYIHENPVRARLVERAADHAYGSPSGRFELDGIPPWLKPPELSGEDAGLKPRSSTDSSTGGDWRAATDARTASDCGAPPWLKPPELTGEDAGLKPRSSTDSSKSHEASGRRPADEGGGLKAGSSLDSQYAERKARSSTDSRVSTELHTEPRGSS